MNDKITRKMEEHNFSRGFADKMYALMQQREINQTELANRTGILLSSINQYVNCKQMPSVYAASKIAKVLGVSLDYLTN